MMKLEQCDKCKFNGNVDFMQNEVLCNYWEESTHRIMVRRAKEVFIKDCPKEQSIARHSVLQTLKDRKA